MNHRRRPTGPRHLGLGRAGLRAVACICALMLPAAGLARPKDPKAAELLQEGVRHYEAEELDEAVQAFKQGYEIEADPAFLYAWAQAERQRGRCAAAVRLYQKFLATNPSELHQEAAKDGIVRCADQLADDEALPPGETTGGDEVSPPEPEPEPEPITRSEPTDEPPEPSDKKNRWYLDPLGTSLVAVGVAGVGVGTGLVVAAQIEEGEESTDYGEFDERTKRVRTFRIAGGTVLGIGGALLIGGVVRWAIVGTRGKRQTAFVPVFNGKLAGVSISGRF